MRDGVLAKDMPDAGRTPDPSHNILVIRNLRFTYPAGTVAIGDVSVAIARGSITGIVGPSGCGKSTLLYLVSGLLAPDCGTIERNVDPNRHPISMVFQQDTLLPWLSAAENVRLFARFRKHRVPGRVRRSLGRLTHTAASERTEEIDARVARLLELAHLADRASSYPYQLSGGMRRRLAFLSGVAPHSELLLLDEPFTAVDEPTRVGIHQDIWRILRMERITTLLVTHDLGEAITLCDRVLMLSGAPARIVGDYAMPFMGERVMLDLRASSTFLELYGRLWDDLSAQIKGSSTAPDSRGWPRVAD